MKTSRSLPTYFFVLLAIVAGFSFGKKNNRPNLPKSLEKLKAVTFIPAGRYGNQDMPAFYMFTSEVSNLQYNEFLWWLKQNGRTETLSTAQPDTSLWKTAVDANGNEWYARQYHHMPEYPAVNIGRQAAEAYCHWLTEIWNARQNDFVVEFRLPTVREWEYAASGGNSTDTHPYPWNGRYCRDSKGVYLAQHKAFGLSYGPQKTGSFTCNVFGLYNMSGNVAEMVADQNVAKGGHWNSNAQEIRIDATAALEQSPFTGFRPVMTFVARSR